MSLSILPILYLILILIIPIGSLLATSNVENFWSLATEPVALSAYFVTFSMALIASLVNGVFGFLLAWVLVRYDFPGKKTLDAAIDLPFALPTSVAGLTLATIYSPGGWIGQLVSCAENLSLTTYCENLLSSCSSTASLGAPSVASNTLTDFHAQESLNEVANNIINHGLTFSKSIGDGHNPLVDTTADQASCALISNHLPRIEPHIQLVQTRTGVALAMIFVSFPFVVRNLQPVLQEMDTELEEIAWSLGANSWVTFRKIILPPLLPTWIAGITLSFSRAIGEYGSVVVMASNIPLKDLIASVLVFQKLEQYETVGATVIGTVVLLISLSLLFGVQILQNYFLQKKK